MEKIAYRILLVTFVIIMVYCMPNNAYTFGREKILISEQGGCLSNPCTLSLVDRANSLKSLFYTIQQSQNSQNNLEYKKQFLDLFPGNFHLFNSIYGYDDKKGPRILYFEAEEHLKLFFEIETLENLDKDSFYRKIIKIAFYGAWEADAIGYFQYGLQGSLAKNISDFYKVLSEYTNDEILSFWYFFYDGPHPENYDDLFKELYANGYGINKDISELMQQAYNKLFSGKKCDGH